MYENSNKKDVRRMITERIAWALFHQDQFELGLMIEDHYSNLFRLTFDEREIVCEAWKLLEEGII
jgi:hypothetical protein